MAEDANELVLRLHRDAVERLRREPPPSADRPPTPSPELPEAPPDSPVAAEWNLFRAEVGRLLRDGYERRFALVKVGHPVTVWDTRRDAIRAGQLLYGPSLCLVQEILPFLRPLRVGYNRPCRD
jgi:hypothetical protein